MKRLMDGARKIVSSNVTKKVKEYLRISIYDEYKIARPDYKSDERKEEEEEKWRERKPENEIRWGAMPQWYNEQKENNDHKLKKEVHRKTGK